jgi:hypothetical protein
VFKPASSVLIVPGIQFCSPDIDPDSSISTTTSADAAMAPVEKRTAAAASVKEVLYKVVPR